MSNIENEKDAKSVSPQWPVATRTLRTPKGNRLQLTTVSQCRRELAKLYWACRRGEIDSQHATRLAYILVALSSMIKDHGFEQRLEALENK